jgi:hypothetical protein
LVFEWSLSLVDLKIARLLSFRIIRKLKQKYRNTLSDTFSVVFQLRTERKHDENLLVMPELLSTVRGS